MSKNKAFYYVESAPQILSAYKHIKHKCINHFDMIVRLNGNLHNDNQIRQVLQDLNLCKHGNVVAKPLGLLFAYSLLRIILFNRYANFCIADIRSKVGLIGIIFSRCNQLILLDDGTASFDYYQLRIEGAKGANPTIISRLLTYLASNKLNQIGLHTMLPLRSINGMKVELSEFDFASILGARDVEIDKKLAIFIGSKVVECGICSIDNFIKTINKFANEHSNYNLQYIAHRDEDTEKLNLFPQIKIVRLFRPLELEFGILRPIPAVICSFYSAGIIHFLPYRKYVKIFSYELPLDINNIKFHQSIGSSRKLFNDILLIDSI